VSTLGEITASIAHEVNQPLAAVVMSGNACRRWLAMDPPDLAEAREAAEHLRPIGFVAIVTSDLQRAARTAALLASGIGLDPAAVRVEAGLRERDVGRWSGLTGDEIDARWPGQIAAWRHGELDGPPGGERNDAFAARVRDALVRVAATVAGREPVLVVSHGGVVRAVERSAGVEAHTLPNLGGRWFDVDRDRVVAGDPVFTTWNAEERGGLYCGLWQATPGKWRIRYDEWEYCRILEGLSVITEERGAARIVRAGDSFVIRPGFRGTWEVLETTLKDYVIST
jgi:uncharacterized cupin superfamily protein